MPRNKKEVVDTDTNTNTTDSNIIDMDADNIGILDYKGLNKNPLTGLEYSEQYKNLAKVWSRLPAYKDNKKIIQTIANNNVLLIESSTGSGKTVLVPKYVLHSFNYEKKIAITLPKKAITLSSAEFSAKTLDVKLGEEVGYQYKGNSNFSDRTKLLYATDGTIVARLMNNPELPDFDAVIIDEAHERKVQIDLLLFLLRETLKLRKDFKLIIMSATINVELFKNYYKDFKFQHIVLAGESHYPITSYFLDNTMSYQARMNKGFEILKEILQNLDSMKNTLDKDKDKDKDNDYNDILFFITSQNEAFSMCRKLNSIILEEATNKKCQITCNNKILCLELFSGVDIKRKDLALSKEYRNLGYTVKVIFTTNVAESSLTVDTIKYVIDNGHELNDSYDPNIRADKLDRKLITKAQATQRMGRAGRTSPGICYHLYTKDEYEILMDKFPKPAIKVSNIFGESLKILNLPGIGTINQLQHMIANFIEPPAPEYLEDAVNQITENGFITGTTINTLGIIAASLLNDPHDSLAIIVAKLLNCSHEVLKILTLAVTAKDNLGSILRIPSENDKGKRDEYEKYIKMRKNIKHKYGDYLTLLNIFDSYEEERKKIIDTTDNHKDRAEKIDKWCKNHFYKKDTLKIASKEYKQVSRNIQKKLENVELVRQYINIDFEQTSRTSLDDRILLSFVYSHNIAQRNLFNDVYNTSLIKKKGMKLNLLIDKNSFMREKGKDMPKKVVYKKLFITEGQPSLVIVSKIPKKLDSFIINKL